MKGLSSLWALSALAFFSGCHSPSHGQLPRCNSDSECSGGEVCFPDGCGDPGQNLVVEVTPNAWAGEHAQELLIPTLRAVQDLELAAPSRVTGVVTRIGAAGGAPAPYTAAFRVTALVQSALLPDVLRRFEAAGSSQDGTFDLPISPGTLALTTTPADISIPTASLPSQTVAAGGTLSANFQLETAADLLRLEGRVLRVASTNLPVREAVVSIQALEEGSLSPLSQSAAVSSGDSSSTGAFTLFLSSMAKQQAHVLLRVSPQQAGAPVPTHVFTIDPAQGLPDPLELGDYGSAVAVTGVLKGPDGLPVSSATVYLSGEVVGGQYEGPRASTDSSGKFSVQALPSSSLIFWAIPPAQAIAGVLQLSISVPNTGKDLGDLLCPQRPTVTGRLLSPDAQTPAAGVQVLAAPRGKAAQPLPTASRSLETATDGQGNFLLQLDPGAYRLDFLSQDATLPRVSRFIRVDFGSSLQLGDLSLSRGRTVQGQVSSLSDPQQPGVLQAQPFAAVRFFRVATVDEQSTSVLLAEGVTDQLGQYSVVLPTR